MATRKSDSKPKKSGEGVKKAAKSIKAKRSNVASAAQFPILLQNALVSAAPAVSVPVSITITFIAGIGQVTASLFRNGLMINSQSISTDGTVLFSDAQAGDVISVNGVCTGSGGANITINRATSPSTPQHFNTGFIISGYLVL